MNTADARTPEERSEERRIALEAKVMFLEQTVEALSAIVYSQGRELQDALAALDRVHSRLQGITNESIEPPTTPDSSADAVEDTAD